MSGAGSLSGPEAPSGLPRDPNLRATAVALAILIASSAIDFLTHTLLGRWLGERDYGEYGVALSLTLLLGYVACMGGDESVPRFLPAYRARKSWGLVIGFLRSQLALVVLTGSLVEVAGLLVDKILPAVKLPHPAIIGLFIVPMAALSEFLFVTLNSLGRTVTAAFFHQVAWPLVALGACGTLVLARGHLTTELAMIGFALGALSTLPIYGILVHQALPRGAWQTRPKYHMGLWVRTALPMAMATVVYYGFDQIDLLVMEHVGDENQVGILLACIKITDFVYLSYSAAYLVVSPRISPLVASGRTEELRRLVTSTIRAVFLVSSAVSLLAIFFGQTILGWFGPGFVNGEPVLIIMALSNVGVATLSLSWPLLSLTGRERVPLAGLIVAALALLVLAEVLVPEWGMIGAAVAKSVVNLGLFAFLSWQARKTPSHLPRGEEF